MNYSSSSPGNYGGPPGSSGPPGPGTPIMPSPQDSSNSGGENMYTMMKPVPGGNMPGVSSLHRSFCFTYLWRSTFLDLSLFWVFYLVPHSLHSKCNFEFCFDIFFMNVQKTC